MQEAKALLDAGELEPAIEKLVGEVKASPSDTKLRTFLFELLCFAGQWDRAQKQLDVIGHQSTKAEVGVQVYRDNIKAERDRQRLFSDGLSPHFLSEPPAYVDLHLAAINRMREGNIAEAKQTLERAEEERPALSGKLNNRPFKDFRDYNDLVGPVLELIVKDKYTWLPMEQIKKLDVAPPKQLRDLIWTAARVESLDGTIGEVFLPVLYASSSEHSNNQVRLGRMTDWKDFGEDLYVPLGLRLFLVDEEDKPVFEARSVEFDGVRVSDETAAPAA
jgi:type VI secretion system protein ImpE